MTAPFLEPNDPRLLQTAAAVDPADITSDEIQADLRRLFDVAHPEQSDKSRAVLVGVSASQIGLGKRIVLIDVAADGHGRTGDLRVYINPVISESSEDAEDWYEGCYSTAPICGVVSRPRRITMEAYNESGQPVKETHEGYVARIFQHEIDHLDGRVFIDRITDPTKLHLVEATDYPAYRDQEGWHKWPKQCPTGLWDELKTHGREPKN